MNNLKSKVLIQTLVIGFILNSLAFANTDTENPASIKRKTAIGENGKQIITTEILFDKTTLREDLIHTCNFLATEGVQLTFESLVIGKSFIGILGKKRISYAKGKIELPGGSVEKFEAGGAFSFRSVKISYSENEATGNYLINMVEVID